MSQESFYALRSYGVVLLLACLGATPLPARAGRRVLEKLPRASVILQPLVLVALLGVCTAFLVDGSFNPFLYFRF